MPRIVLVHGTWGNGIWRSFFWAVLPQPWRKWRCSWGIVSALIERGVTVHPFSWTGLNTHRARMTAGKALADFISSLRQCSDDAIWILAHSHGGNVALYALNHLPPNTVEKFVFLATPFLHFSPQKYDWIALWHGRWIIAVFGGIVGVVAYGLLIPNIGPELIVVWATITAVLWKSGHWVISLGGRWLSRVHTACETVQPPAPSPDSALILRKVGDEASMALEAVRFIEWLLAKSWFLLSFPMLLPRLSLQTTLKLSGKSLLFSRPVAFLILFGMPVALVTLWTLGHFIPLQGIWSDPKIENLVFFLALSLLFGIVIFVLVVLALQLACLLLIALLSLTRLGTGVPGAAFMRITAEATPRGRWLVEVLPSTGFAHSEIYEDSAATTRITSWLYSSPSDLSAKVG